jgi:hypothetical protein
VLFIKGVGQISKDYGEEMRSIKHVHLRAAGETSPPLPKKARKKPYRFFLVVEPDRAHRGASIAPTDGLWK